MIIQYMLIALVGCVGSLNSITGQSLCNRPIVLGALVGLVLGDIRQGVIIGCSLELAYMGVVVIGVSSSVNMNVAGTLGTAFAMLTGSGAEVAIALAIPCSLMMTLIGRVYSILRLWLVRFADDCGKKGDYKGVERWHWTFFFIGIAYTFIVYFLALLLGGEVIQTIVDAVPAFIMQGLQAGTALLPGLGFAMLLNMIWSKEIAAFFFIGFVLSVYLGLDNTSIAILAGCIAILFFFFMKTENNDDVEETDEIVERERLLDKKTLNSIHWRSYALEGSFNSERFQGFGFAYSMIPALKKFYGEDTEEFKEALSRHMEFFNTTPTCVTLITGVALAMEEEKAVTKTLPGSAVSNVKVALMGPVAGIGDSIFWGSYRIICASIGCQLGMTGSIMGPLVFLILFNIPNVLIHYFGLMKTYEFGNSFIKKMYASNVMDKITLCCSIMGIMMIGSMTASLVEVSTPFTATFGETTFVLQELLDAILPGMLPLLTVFGISHVLKKQVSVMNLMMILLLVGIIGRFFGLL